MLTFWTILHDILQRGRREEPFTMARNQLRGDYSEIIGDSPQIFEVLQQIEHFAATS